MHILILEGASVEGEFRQKFGPDHTYTFWNDADGADPTDFAAYEEQQNALAEIAATADVVFDFSGGLSAVAPGVPVFVEATTQSLAGTHFGPGGDRTTPTFGFCGLPTLLGRPLLEVSVVDGGDGDALRATCERLGTDFRVVRDRVGLATPRVLAMLVNEACYTLQEGTAAAADIDRAMQLGTNYPRGPLAWGDALGPERVVAILDAVYQDTADPRYRVCPLLRTRATLGEALLS